MSAIVEQGHTLGAHSWSQHIIPAYQSRDEEHEDLKRCIRELSAASGAQPRGWISPRATPSLNTPELLAQEGLEWYADAFDRDTPYHLDTAKGAVLAMPFTMEVNDFPLCVRYGNEPEMFNRVLAGILEGWRGLRIEAGCLDITAHAHVFGRPAGVIAFIKAVRQALECPHAWVTHHGQLADIYAASAPRSYVGRSAS